MKKETASHRKLTSKKNYQTGLSIPGEIHKSALKRMSELGHSTFSGYVSTLIRRDLDGWTPAALEKEVQRAVESYFTAHRAAPTSRAAESSGENAPNPRRRQK